MAIERERKFFIKDLDAVLAHRPMSMKAVQQGYLSTDPEHTTRVRIIGGSAYITVKGRRVLDSCLEFEFEIPREQAEQIMKMCSNVVEKRRYVIDVGVAHALEIDVFEGANAGLVVAELELFPDEEIPQLPSWVGPEIDIASPLFKLLSNSLLSTYPFTLWDEYDSARWTSQAP